MRTTIGEPVTNPKVLAPERDSPENVVRRYPRFLNAGDFEGMMALHDDDEVHVTVVAPNRIDELLGWAPIEEELRCRMKEGIIYEEVHLAEGERLAARSRERKAACAPFVAWLAERYPEEIKELVRPSSRLRVYDRSLIRARRGAVRQIALLEQFRARGSAGANNSRRGLLTMSLSVYVPRPESELRRTIWPGSGIVGSEQGETGRLRIDFEGDQDRYPAYEDRLRRAAERHQWFDGEHAGYPTRACAYEDEGELREVGSYALGSNELVVDDSEGLEEWLEGENR